MSGPRGPSCLCPPVAASFRRRALALCLAWAAVPAWSWAAGSTSALQAVAGGKLSGFCNSLGGSAALCGCRDVTGLGSRLLEEELRRKLEQEVARLHQM